MTYDRITLGIIWKEIFFVPFDCAFDILLLKNIYMYIFLWFDRHHLLSLFPNTHHLHSLLDLEKKIIEEEGSEYYGNVNAVPVEGDTIITFIFSCFCCTLPQFYWFSIALWRCLSILWNRPVLVIYYYEACCFTVIWLWNSVECYRLPVPGRDIHATPGAKDGGKDRRCQEVARTMGDTWQASRWREHE